MCGRALLSPFISLSLAVLYLFISFLMSCAWSSSVNPILHCNIRHLEKRTVTLDGASASKTIPASAPPSFPFLYLYYSGPSSREPSNHPEHPLSQEGRILAYNLPNFPMGESDLHVLLNGQPPWVVEEL